jgi:hypothetical protein
MHDPIGKLWWATLVAALGSVLWERRQAEIGTGLVASLAGRGEPDRARTIAIDGCQICGDLVNQPGPIAGNSQNHAPFQCA